jgi:transcriptional regulator of heat shock response
MNERLASILETTVREFIRTGEPISSGHLYKRYDFGIRPARIRSELQELTNLGLLVQPHHSAGRVPSDAGYEFFVSQVLELGSEVSPSAEILERFFKKSDWPDLVQGLSKKFSVFGIAEDLLRGEIYKEGLNNLIENWDTPHEIKEIIRDLEHLEERLDALRERIDEERGIEVFIGRKSPVTRSSELSIIAGTYHDQGKDVTLVAIGPKRMNYKSVVGVFKNLQKAG